MNHWWSRRLVRALALLVALTAMGIAGYMILERWSVADALFMTVVILSTVGLEASHAHRLTGAGLRCLPQRAVPDRFPALPRATAPVWFHDGRTITFTNCTNVNFGVACELFSAQPVASP